VKVIGVYSIKGGVGKTSTAVNLAHMAAKEGQRVLLWDLDPQAAATFYLRVKPHIRKAHRLLRGELDPFEAIKASDYPGLDLLPSDFANRNMDLLFGSAKKPRRQLGKVLQPLSAEYDVVLLDCAPSISLTSENVLRASDALLVPVIPTPLSVRTLTQLLDFLEKERMDAKNVWPFFSMVDRHNDLHRELMMSPPEKRLRFMIGYVPLLGSIERMGVERSPVASYAPSSTAEFAYQFLWHEMLQRFGMKPPSATTPRRGVRG